MLNVSVSKIKHSTVGSSFSVTFSTPPEELTYLMVMYEWFKKMNYCSFPIERKDEPPIECKDEPLKKWYKCIEVESQEVWGKYEWEEPKMPTSEEVLSTCVAIPAHHKDEPQTCANCKHNHDKWFEEPCASCCGVYSNWEPEDEQTDCAWK